MSTAEHWNNRYTTAGIEQVSWFEREATMSLALIEATGVTPDTGVLDVGGGASPLADGLLARGFTDITVVDVSAVALDHARRRLGADAARVTWVESDVRDWSPERQWGLWHDRAVFHFLTDPADRSSYLGVLKKSLAPGGTVVLGTFADDGPERCSGLPVMRYDPDSLAAIVAKHVPMDIITVRRHVHVTPAGVEQQFAWMAGKVTG